MTPAQLAQLLPAAEDARLERKPEGVNRAEIRQTIVAFANSVGPGEEAVLFVGVHDNGVVQGVANPDATQQLVNAICAQDCYPPVPVQSFVLDVNGRRVVAIVVAHSDAKPHFAGPAFVRIGAASVTATPAQYEALIASRHQKCGVLQRWNQPITVREQGYRLQTMQVTPAWGATRLCLIETCNAHNVTIRDLGSGAAFTIPMQHVQIAYDHAHNRNQITVVPA
jgi:hypothetical protein